MLPPNSWDYELLRLVRGFLLGRPRPEPQPNATIYGTSAATPMRMPQQTRSRLHRPKRTSTLGHGDIERVHVGSRTGLPHDCSGAADMIRVTVSENQVLELVRRTAETANRLKDGCLLAREAGVTALGSLMGIVTFAITWSFFFPTPGVVKWSISADPIAWNLAGEFLYKDIVLLCVCVVLFLASLPNKFVPLRASAASIGEVADAVEGRQHHHA
jgi:Protein of unknown function, DUF417